MKKHVFPFLFLLFSLLSTKQFAAGGPDAYGYTWLTSVDAGGPTYSWIDITTRPGVQTVTGLADDNSAPSMFNIGFYFHYYWNDYTQLKVGSNGWLGFNNTSNIASCFPTIPTAGGAADNYLAPLMGDLNFTGAGNPGQVKYWTNNVDTCIISYINVPFWTVSAPGWGGSNSFQVILSATDSSITFQYGALGGFVSNAACVDLTVGMENSSGTIGLQPYSDVMPPPNFSIKFDYPDPVLLSVTDVSPIWNENSANKGAFIFKDAAQPLLTKYRNVGNAAVSSIINFQETIVDAASTTIHSSVSSVPMLAAGQDTLITFPSSWTPTLTGQYSFRSSLTNSMDINPGNDVRTTQFSVVDLCTSSMQLSYVTGASPSGSINWNGGVNDDGVAVYFKPPVYPYTISDLQYYISSNVGNYFISEIYDDDGAGGGPGTLLFNTTVPSGSVVSGAWNTVNVTPALTLNDGGFYVVWIQGGVNIFLGCETTSPYSNQNYEILDGGWASLRYNDGQDACIRATISNYPTLPVAGYTSSSALLDVAFANTTTGPAVLYSWDFGDGQTSVLSNPSHTYSTPGTYNVCLVSSSTCGSDTVCQSITVCDPVSASYTSSNVFLNVNFTDASTAATSWSWDFGDGNTSMLQSPSHTYAASGTYNVCLIVSSPCASDTVCQTVSVCDDLVAAYSTTSSYLNMNFMDNSTVSATSWSWDFGDGNTSTLQSPSHTYAGNGTYNVCLIASSLCASDTSCNVYTICDSSASAFSMTQTLDSVLLTDVSAGTINSWFWDFGDGVTSSLQNVSHAYTSPGTYSICLTITTDCDTSTSCQSVIILMTSIAENDQVILSTYPNPAGDQLNVSLKQELQQINIEIMDVAGKRVYQKYENSGTALKIDLSSLQSGMYLLKLNHKQGNSMIRFVKE